MSNAIAIPDSAPSFLTQLIQKNPALVAANEAALANLSAGMHPMIVANTGRFYTKEAGETKPLLNGQGHPLSVLGCVLLTAKPAVEKKLYLTGYNPDSTDAPDCMSSDGVTPDASSRNKQCESCAGCWANQWGTAQDQNGNPTKGKRCADLKKLAVYAAGKTYGFNVPPGSLQNFAAYVRDLSARGIPMWAVITTVGFDLKQPQILTFTFQGMLQEAQVAKVSELIGTPEVKAIVEWGSKTAAALPAPAQPAAQIEHQEANTGAGQPAAAAATGAKPASNRGRGRAASAAQPATGTANAGQMDLGLGLPADDAGQMDLGLDTGAAAADPVMPEATGGNMSDGDIAALLGLPAA